MANLPTMNFSTLSRELGSRESKLIGYQTVAIRVPDGIEVHHHGTSIAVLYSDGGVLLPHVAFSATTAARISAVLSDSATGYRGYSFRPSKDASFLVAGDGELIEHKDTVMLLNNDVM